MAPTTPSVSAATPPPRSSAPEGLRARAARGVLINSGFTIAVSSINLLRGFALAAFLTAGDYGVWGTVLVVYMTVLLLKQVGIGDKYVQQEEPDQEAAFQKAFTLEAIVAGLAAGAAIVLAPVVAWAYGDSRLLPVTLTFAVVLAAAPLQLPIAIFYRRLEYGKQAVLQSIEPVVMTVVSVTAAVAGAGYWALFGGMVAGAWAGAVAAVVASPYKLRFRYVPGTIREYWSFSWPIFVAAGSGTLIALVSVVAANVHLGLAGAGALTLSANIAAFTQRVDTVVTGALYPAICAAAGRLETLRESFPKSNRLALMWAMPFGVALTLFADDLVHFVLGRNHWADAVIVLQVYGVVAAVSQIGFNWDAYFRARSETRPLAIVNVAAALVFLVTAIPLLFIDGLEGFAIGIGIQAAIHLILRVIYLRRLFGGLGFVAHVVRSIVPVLPATAAVLIARQIERGRTFGTALAELAVFAAITALATWIVERRLVGEALGYLRRPRVMDEAVDA